MIYVYLHPIHWIMDDGYLRFLEVEEDHGTKERKQRKGQREGGKEREKIDIKVDRDGLSVSKRQGGKRQ